MAARATAAGRPRSCPVVDSGSADQLAGEGLAHQVTSPGQQLRLGGVTVDVIGGDHAVIHPDIPVIPNNGYLFEGSVLHPGDSFTAPPAPVDALLLPTGAPWLKLSEAVDYLRTVAPPVAVPIHQAVLAMPEMHYTMFRQLAPSGTQVEVATPGEPLAL